MNKEKTAIGPLLLLPLLIIAPVSFGLLFLPHYTVMAMGTNAYLGYLIALIIVTPGLAAIYLLSIRFPGQSIIQQGDVVLGPILGKIMGFIYLGFHLMLLVLFTRDICNLVGTYFLNRTPIFILTLTFMLIAAYLATRGIETISRTASFLFIPALIVLFILVLCGYQNFHWTRILPLFSNDPLDYVKGGLASTGSYYLFGIAAIILPFLKPVRSFPKIALGALCFVVPLYLLFTIGAIGVFGPGMLKSFGWPSLELVHTVDYSYLLLEEAGLVMILDWVSMIILGSGLLYYCVSLGASQLTAKWNYKTWVYILFPIKILLMNLLVGSIQTKWLMDFFARFIWVVVFAYPIFLYLFALLFHRKGGPLQS